jgi:predicted O-linked N-acetylglucosamine transferase (SPINDLY family)
MFATWMDILKEIPRAVLWLIDDNATTTANLKAHALKAGADVERIFFTPRASHEEYRAKLKLADVFLDTFPYNCGSTTNDVINAGVPLVTMSGRTMVSRMGGSLLSSASPTIRPTFSFKDYSEKISSISQNTYSLKYNFSEKNQPSLIVLKIEEYLRQHLEVK